LLPRLFVYLRIPYGRTDAAMLVPERAVLRNEQGSYVLVVDSENRVERRSIEVGSTVENWVVVRSGLGPDEQVILDGIQRALPGNVIDPELTELTFTPSPFIGGEDPLAEFRESRNLRSDTPPAADPDASSGAATAEGDSGAAEGDSGADEDSGAAEGDSDRGSGVEAAGPVDVESGR
jgi:hypothetical protein